MPTSRDRLDALGAEMEALVKRVDTDTYTSADVSALNAKTVQYTDLLATVKANAAASRGVDMESAFLADAKSADFDRDDGLPITSRSAFSTGATAVASEWAATTAKALRRTASEAGVKALLSGAIDIPTTIRADVVSNPRNPSRLTDLIINRRPVEGNEFEYLRQTVRTNNAATVADGAIKPTSVFTVEAVTDRLRVVAHLSQPVPERLFEDHRNVIRFLETEMFNGVMDAVEDQAVNGNGTGENFQGILGAAGTTAVPFDTDALTTARKAWTALQVLHEAPTAWVMSPADAEMFDLVREDTAGMYLSTGPGLSNVFGNLPRIVSTSLPAGIAILADWNQAELFVRSGMQLDADRSGDNFTTNQVVLRAEGRFNIGILRPQAFAIVDLDAAV